MKWYFLISIILLSLAGCGPSKNEIQEAVHQYLTGEGQEYLKEIIRTEVKKEGLQRGEMRRAPQVPNVQNNQGANFLQAKIDTRSAPRLGSEKAPIEIILFSEFECPFCKRGHENFTALFKMYPKLIKIYFFHRPLAFHQHARRAAQYALAASKQRDFYFVADYLFAHQKELAQLTPDLLAKELNLDLKRLKKDIEDRALEERINQDSNLADQLGITGTPTFYINKKRIVGAKPLDELISIIKEESK